MSKLLEDQKLDMNDGSYASRKFVLTIIGLVLVTILAIGGLWYPMVAGIFPTFIGGILGVLSLYFTGNVMSKMVQGKTAVQLQQSSDKVDNPEENE